MLRRILEVPDPYLREIASPVGDAPSELRELAADMFQTMHANLGLGLAATQLGRPRRMVVIALPEDEDDPQAGIPYVLIDPEITSLGDREDMVEGCLSLPGFRAMVDRSTDVTVEFTQPDGSRSSLAAKGLLAQAVQHELDHLDGVLFIDHLDSMLELEQIPPTPLDWDEDEAEDEDEDEDERDDDAGGASDESRDVGGESAAGAVGQGDAVTRGRTQRTPRRGGRAGRGRRRLRGR